MEVEDRLAILSNNHVLADENRAEIDDPIIQPARYDHGDLPEDLVAHLSDFVPLETAGSNRLDAAIAFLADGLDATTHELLGGGSLDPVPVEPQDALGLKVIKVGRTTGRTTGVVTAFNVRKLVVEYDISPNVQFDGQIEIDGEGGDDFSLGGDSGSLIVSAEDYRPVGLLFAGSDQGGPSGGSVTYANPIAEVLDAFAAKLCSGS